MKTERETLKDKAERIKQETAREEENLYTSLNKEEENLFLAATLFWLLKESRKHPELSLKEMARIYKEVFDGAEIKAFIKELNKNERKNI